MNESRRYGHLLGMADYGDRHFDPAAGLLSVPVTKRQAPRIGRSGRHPVHASLSYALVLLELADRSLQGRAEAIIGRVLALQEMDHAQASKQARKDFHLSDFIGMALVLIRHRHGRRLSSKLVGEIDLAVTRIAICIRRNDARSADGGNVFEGVFVMLAASEATGDAELLDHALDRLGRLRDRAPVEGDFTSHGDPASAATELAALHAIRTYVNDRRANALAELCLTRVWREVAEGFDPDPEIRAASLEWNESAGLLCALIEKAGGGEAVYRTGDGNPFDALYACVVTVDAPPDVVAALSVRGGKRRRAPSAYS